MRLHLSYKIVVSFLIAIVLFGTLQSNAYVSGYQGYAVYRDGVPYSFPNLYWHAGLMDEPSHLNNFPVSHAPGLFMTTEWASWERFMAGNNFKGAYGPLTPASDYGRELFVGMGRRLAARRIPYILQGQIRYYSGTPSGYTSVNDISAIRCDGFIEYVFEYYGHRVCGPSWAWDITRNDPDTLAYHDSCNPTFQARGHLVLVNSNAP